MASTVEVFFSYAHEDEMWKNELEKHLSLLQRQGIIATWHDRKITPGTAWADEVDDHLNSAQLILLLVSADFLASDYCWGVELQVAMRRHHGGEACVIPIIIRPVDWTAAPFGKLQALPRDNKAISSWPNRDEAMVQVVASIRQAIAEWDIHQTVTLTSSLPFLTMPFERNPLFTGRENVLEHLHQVLLTRKATALTQRQAISGLGGIGKTQTAVEYAYRYQSDYQVIIWIKADSRETLTTEYITLAHLLHLSIKDGQDESLLLQQIKQWFEQHSGWLLIFDNADDLLVIRPFLPSAEHGHILLTTRSQSAGSIAQPLTLEKMAEEEGILFLLHRSRLLDLDAPISGVTPNDIERAKEIVQHMDGLPLALDQAAAYIEETQCGLAGYLQLYQTRQAELLKRRGRYATDHPESVATTWSLAFEQIQLSQPAAVDLLRLCAYLDPDVIPEELITEGATELGPVLQKCATDSFILHESIGELLKYSLIRRNPDHTLTIHRLVQAIIRQNLNASQQRMWAKRAVKAVYRAFPEVNYSNWAACQQYIPHVLACASLIDEWNISVSESADLLRQAGSYLRDHGDYIQAEPLFRGALAIKERVLEPDHPEVATTLNNLAGLYREMSRYEEAEPLYQRALAIDEAKLGSDHPEAAITLNNLALLYYNMGRYEEAEPLFQRVLAIYEAKLEPDHPEVATTLNNLALLYREMSRYEEAEPLFQRSLAIDEAKLGSDHPRTATTLDNLAGLYNIMGRYEEAEPLFQQALAIKEAKLGLDHPYRAFTLNNLALLYRDMGRYEEAEPLFQQALAIYGAKLGFDHREIATTLNNLALLYRDMGRYEEAEPLYQRTLAIDEAKLGFDHPEAATTLNNLALLYYDMGRYEEAEPLFQRSLAIVEAKLEPDHPDIAIILDNLAGLYRDMGRYEEAEPLFQRSQRIKEMREK